MAIVLSQQGRGLLKSVLWAYSNPQWPMEWAANWPIILPSASARGQNRPPTPPPWGKGPRPIVFWATGRLCTAVVVSHHAISTALLQKPQMASGQWRGSPVGQKCPNRRELKDKAGPQHPPGVLNTPNEAFFYLRGPKTHVGTRALFNSTRVLLNSTAPGQPLGSGS